MTSSEQRPVPGREKQDDNHARMLGLEPAQDPPCFQAPLGTHLWQRPCSEKDRARRARRVRYNRTCGARVRLDSETMSTTGARTGTRVTAHLDASRARGGRAVPHTRGAKEMHHPTFPPSSPLLHSTCRWRTRRSQFLLLSSVARVNENTHARMRGLSPGRSTGLDRRLATEVMQQRTKAFGHERRLVMKQPANPLQTPPASALVT